MHYETTVDICISCYDPETKISGLKTSWLGVRHSRDGAMAGIYLVENDPAALRVAQLILGSRSHVIVGTATNASDAKAGIQATKPDLCMIDISLGHGTSGIDVAEFVIEKSAVP
jgi:ActR/RegA family two-component response regulator